MRARTILGHVNPQPHLFSYFSPEKRLPAAHPVVQHLQQESAFPSSLLVDITRSILVRNAPMKERPSSDLRHTVKSHECACGAVAMPFPKLNV
jgi:hypothetical protein